MEMNENKLKYWKILRFQKNYSEISTAIIIETYMELFYDVMNNMSHDVQIFIIFIINKWEN